MMCKSLYKAGKTDIKVNRMALVSIVIFVLIFFGHAAPFAHTQDTGLDPVQFEPTDKSYTQTADRQITIYVCHIDDLETPKDDLATVTTDPADSAMPEQDVGVVFALEGEEPVPVHSIDNIVFKPPSPATLEFGNDVNITFDYYTNHTDKVIIYTQAMLKGGIKGYAHNSGSLPPGEGSGSSFFRVFGETDPKFIDQVRFRMHCAEDHNLLLYEQFVDVDYTFKPVQTFTDVTTDHPFFVEIEALVASGITTGYEDGTFRPSANVTRMAMAAFLYRGLELEDAAVAEPTFSDVPADHPFFTEIEALAVSGITTGYIDGTFRPSANVTRMAVAAFLVRGLELDQKYNVPAQPTFSDVPLTHPFYEEIELLAASGITTGYDDGTFRPSANVTRMAMAAFLVRGLELDNP